jgi:hypothetical protein
MDGILGGLNQGDNSLEASSAEGDFEGGSGHKTEGTQAGNVSEKEVFKVAVIGDVEKNPSSLNAWP